MTLLCRLLAAALLAAGMSGCGEARQESLRAELHALGVGLKGKVKPLPVVKPYTPFDYDVSGEPDPFSPLKIDQALTAAGAGPAPDLRRVPETLEGYPLDSLVMVGTITDKGVVYGLVQAGDALFRVRKGNYMGQDHGRITSITAEEIVLKETTRGPGGAWIERMSSLKLDENREPK